jgi:hypothetical protein
MAKSSFKTAGFYSKRAQKLNGPPNGEPWIWLPLSLVESEAFRSLSVHASRALFRIAAEHAHQGGKENGRLKVTTRDLYAFGVRWVRVNEAIQELEHAGLVRVTVPGRKVCGAAVRPHMAAHNRAGRPYSAVKRVEARQASRRTCSQAEGYRAAQAPERCPRG